MNIDRPETCSCQLVALQQRAILSKGFNHFLLFITKTTTCINNLFKKTSRPFHNQNKYPRFCQQVLEWKFVKAIRSLEQVHYAQIKRNPE